MSQEIELPKLDVENADLVEIHKKIIPLALPWAITQLIVIASSFLCMTMVAQLGHEVLAASALIFSTHISIMIIGMSILFSISILVGHAYGAGQYAKIGQFVQQGWTIALILSIPIMILFWHIGSVLIFFGQSKSIANIVQQFFYAYNWRVVPILLAVCNQQLCYGVHKQKLDILSNIIGVTILISLSYVLIFGKFGFPNLGVVGLAYAISAQAWFYFLFSLFLFCKIDFFKRFDLFRYRIHKDWRTMLHMLKIGWPISVQISNEMLSLFASAAMIGWLGVNALAAYQVTTQYLYLIVIPTFAISQASGVLVGQAYGSKQFIEIKKVGYLSLKLAIAISLISAFFFIFFPRWLASIYLNVNDPANAVTVHYIVLLFSVMAISQIFDSIRNVMMGSLRGLLDTKFPMYAGILALWIIGIPLGYLLAFALQMGPVGIVIGSAIGMFVGAIMMCVRFRKRTRTY